MIGTERGAVFAFERPGTWDIAGVEVHGALYHAVAIERGLVTRIEDHVERAAALSAAGA